MLCTWNPPPPGISNLKLDSFSSGNLGAIDIGGVFKDLDVNAIYSNSMPNDEGFAIKVGVHAL